MKKLPILTFVAFIATASFGQTSTLEQAVNEGLTLLDSARTIQDVQSVVNRFQRIAMAEPARWEPLYHQAYSQITLSFWEQDGNTKDKILDEAESAIEKALELKGDISELHALQAFLYQGRIQVNASRGMTYSMKAKEILEQAMRENTDNPRAFFLMAQNIYYTPEGFGGGCANALPVFMAARERFEKEQGKMGCGPKWGAKTNARLIEQCNNEK
ncbi:MAG: hypothetical protein JW830_15460 [Bacteroidales bacterium]|nr:hypothetical protein [Bacteroidales bacterium]